MSEQSNDPPGFGPPPVPPPPPSAAAVPRGFTMVAADADADSDPGAGDEPAPHLADPAGRPSTGTLLRRTSRTLTSSFVPFFTLSLIVYSPVFLLAAVVLALAAAGRIAPELLAVLAGGTLIATVVFSPIAAAALVQGVFETLRGGRADVGASARVAFRRLGAVIGLALMVGLGTIAGTMLCIIPGVMVACGLFIATPVLLVERTRVGEAWNRSWSLSNGYKLSIFGLLLLIGLIENGLGAILEVALVSEGMSMLTFAVYLFAVLLLTTFLATVRGIAAVVCYHDLRRFREGLDEEELAAIFE